ncbi:DUF916 and DUF3324 domain-containing protein [Weissella diestrammenae]|uniref:DUF916 and DUF3324 domain-containing protein n=1 Tax=Weissella diestrammenae TaxID=1162633 RepID=A0A7G9T434_9LACO|nr:DUF916 and DUF3324 domain-containing protein [Weissella diestrammenae]MCM0583381.1 DUF916 and DUF3324 domain-containing protein [Weissella diestrammenae]QNN74859.1 DUF916 and DUF3324 domain-containing protein [Weissella diestrammenae]
MLKKLKLMTWLSVAGLLLGLVSTVPHVHAEGADFTVSPVYGSGQTQNDLGYFSLKTDAGKTYQLTVTVQNLDTKNANQFKAQLVTASTSNTGAIDYTPSKQKMVKGAKTLLPSLTSKADRSQKFSIEPGQSKNVTFNVKIPKKGYRGTILGSVYVKKVTKTETTNQSFGIKNTFAMTVPAVLTQDPDETISPKVALTKAGLDTSGGQPQISGRIENSEPVMFGKIKMDAWVTKRGQTKRLYEKQAKDLAMAPQSTFNYAIDTKNVVPAKGTYTLHVKMVSGKKTFNLARNFTIDGTTRQKISKRLANSESIPYIWLWGLLAVILIVLIALGAYLLGRRRSVEKDDE